MGKRVNRHVTKEDLKMTNTRKDIQRLMSVENCKLKQATTTIQLLGWPRSKTLIAPNAGGDLENPNAKWCSHL